MKAMTSRRATFLSNPEWCNFPWSVTPKSSFHQFLDLAAESPCLLELADSLPSANLSVLCTTVQNTRQRLLNSLAELVQRLKRWDDISRIYLPHEPSYLTPAWGESMVPSDQPRARTHRYPSKYPLSLGTAFEILQSARLKLFYWSTVLTLCTTVYGIFTIQDDSSRENKELSLYRIDDEDTLALDDYFPLSLLQVDHVADNISIWADFCSQSAWQSFGPAIAIFSLKAAIRWYEFRQTQFSLSSSTSASRSQRHLLECLDLLARLTFCDSKSKWA
jgi:hypothetical protein